MAVLLTEQPTHHCIWGIWEITETLPELYDLWTPNEHDTAYFLGISHEDRKIQSVAARVLVKHLLQQWDMTYWGIGKNAAGQPWLVDTNYYVSVSHTKNYASAILHAHSPVGIDMEPVKEKLQYVMPRILTPDEWQAARTDIEKLGVYWCAKEALYKLHGRKQLSFREHIHLKNFEMKKNGTLFGRISTDEYQKEFRIFYQKIHTFILAYSFDSETSP